MLLLEDDSMHSVHRAITIAVWKELFTLHCRSNNIADQWIFLRQISREIHFLPFEFLSNSKTRKSEIRANRCSFYEIQKSILIKDKCLNKILTLWININALRVHLLVVLLDAEHLAVPVLVLKDMGVLLSFQP